MSEMKDTLLFCRMVDERERICVENNNFESNEFIQKGYLNPSVNEIKLRADWLYECYNEINEELNMIKNSMGYSVETIMTQEITKPVFRKCMEFLNHSIVIMRIVTGQGARPKEKEMAERRVQSLLTKYPELRGVTPPENLSKIRNDYEHFDTRIDDWAENNGRWFLDMYIGDSNVTTDIKTEETIRGFQDGTLRFFGTELNLSEVNNWAKGIKRIVSK